MTRPASRAELEYLQQRVDGAHRMLQAAKGARLGATIIKRRERVWKERVALLAAAWRKGRAAA